MTTSGSFTTKVDQNNISMELIGILMEMREKQTALLAFVGYYLSGMKMQDPADHILIAYAALMPHFRARPTCERLNNCITVRIDPKHMESVRREHFMSPENWANASLKLHQALDKRGVYRASVRRTQNDMLNSVTLKLSPKAQRRSEALFLAIWEMEARALEAKKIAIAP